MRNSGMQLSLAALGIVAKSGLLMQKRQTRFDRDAKLRERMLCIFTQTREKKTTSKGVVLHAVMKIQSVRSKGMS